METVLQGRVEVRRVEERTLVRIVSTGMVTAVGATAPASCAAIAAGIAGFVEIPATDGGGFPITGALARHAVPRKLGFPLLLGLLALTVEEALGDAPADDIPVLVALSPSDQAGRPLGLDDAILPALAARLRTQLHGGSRVFAAGSTGVLRAIAHARSLLAAGRARACLVAGVDSLTGMDCLDQLDADERLKTTGNPDGLIPGEAAACLMVAPAGPRPPPDAVLIRGIGFAHEPVGIKDERPILGVALAAAINAALADAGLTMADVDFRIADVTGERYGMNEANYALGRTLKMRKLHFDFLHLGDCVGAIGAASAAAMLAYLKYLFDQGRSPHPGALCHCSSDTGDRAAAIVTGPMKE